MNKEQQELLDEAFLNYWKKVSVNNEEDCLVKQEEGSFLKEVRALYQQEFINKCKTDTEFSEKWGLTIEERELNTDERNKWFQINLNGNNPLMKSDWKDYELNQQNIPTKQITVTYNNETIESYE
jgi:hypothetical protein